MIPSVPVSVGLLACCFTGLVDMSRERNVMKTLISKEQSILLATILVGAALTGFGASKGWAQQKHKISGKTLSKYTQQHVIDVGDVPGHQIRIFEVHHTFPQELPVFEGVKAVDLWVRGFSDFSDTNGRSQVYFIYVLENGDKIFAPSNNVTQTITKPDGSKRSTVTAVSTITGGTGKFLGIRGTIRSTTVIDPSAGLVGAHQFEGEYWLQK